MELVALKTLRYDRKIINKGNKFPVKDKDAHLLKAAGLAKDIEVPQNRQMTAKKPQVQDVEEKPKRRGRPPGSKNQYKTKSVKK